MRINIKECELYGIKEPFLFFSGWVESSASKLRIRLKTFTCYELSFSKTKSKIHSFSIRTPLKSNGWKCIYEVDIADYEGKWETVTEFESTPYKRFAQKFVEDKFNGYSKDIFKDYRNLIKMTYNLKNETHYNEWIKKHETFSPVISYHYNPLISIIIPVYNVERKYLSKCLDSILNQTYQNFEICLADDCSTNRETIDTLQEYVKKDNRVKVLFRKENGHISEASNSALGLASGEFVAMMDNDDELMPQALNEIVSVLNEDCTLDFIYTDEDKIDLEGNRSDPQFKPDLAIDKLYGGNYICHFNVIRRTILEEVGGFRKGYEGAQDFDLFIRIVELTKKFYHIPKVLYHWRMIPGSTALDAGSKNYAGEAGKRALEDLFDKKKINVQVDIVVNTHYSVEYILENEPKVEILMLVDIFDSKLQKRLKAMQNNLAYGNIVFTFICENAESRIQFFSEVVDKFNCIESGANVLSTINKVISLSESKYFLFLDQKAQLETFDTLELMSGYCSQEEIGAVGAKILNNQKTVIGSGYFLVNEKLLPVYYATYFNDYGHYGNLLVTNNYRIIENVCFMISKSKFNVIGGFDPLLDFSNASFDFFLKLDYKGYRNVVIPRIEVALDKNTIDENDTKFKLPIAKWRNNGFDVEYDKFYNLNLSDKIGFRLDR